jgi:saccharopine dehydrogenase-like NADP-dependent oxidoreductase
MGQVAVRDLVESNKDLAVVIADFNLANAQKLAKERGGRSCAVFADITKKDNLVEVLAGADVVINSTPYYYNVAVMEAALQAGCHYIDLGGLFHVTREQQKLHERFVQKKLLAILGMGAAPGMTNVMAAAAADQLDTVESIDIIIGCVDFVSTDHPLAPPYALDTLLDEYTKEPMVFEKGEFVSKPPMSGEVRVKFPEPVGDCPAILTLHSEVATLPETYKDKGVQRVTFRLGLPGSFHEKLKLLVDIGFGGSELVTVGDAAMAPRKLLGKLLERFPITQQSPDDCEVVRVDVTGMKGGKRNLIRVETIVRSHEAWKLSSGALDTGVPPSIAAQLILSGVISVHGVHAPETCVPSKELFAELEKRSISIKQTIEKAGADAAPADRGEKVLNSSSH